MTRQRTSSSDVRFVDVSFRYESMTRPLFTDLNLHLSTGWTGVVGPNGAGKTTLLALAVGMLRPDRGTVVVPERALYCPQRTDEPPPRFGEFMTADDGEALAARGRLAIGDDWLERWPTLSHGERKRAQIGTLLWAAPDELAVDEPTNHIDSEARDLLRRALASFRGVGLLVSHDRELLDGLCHQCVFVDPSGVHLRPGGYSDGAEQAGTEADQARTDDAQARKEVKRLEREAQRRRSVADQSDKRRSKRGLSVHDHDAKAKVDLALVSGKDGVGGRVLAQIQSRVERAREERAAIVVTKTYETGIWLDATPCQRNVLFTMAATELPLGGDVTLTVPNLVMIPGERIAVTGPNGAGKSTLLGRIVESLPLPPERVTYLPQELSSEQSRQILADVRALPRDRLGKAMTVVSRLGSRPDRLLESELPSPGEVRKLLLALGVARDPWLVVMDEPTNHLDLVSIECLEEALEGCPAGLLLVSHDRRFLEGLTTKSWHLQAGAGGYDLVVS